MYGHYRNSGIRRITRYEEALYVLNNTKPIAGKGINAGVVPLGYRNKTQYQIRMRQDESIACRLYRTDVVVFDKSGVITLNPEGYSTISTAAFITDVLGVDTNQHDNKLVVCINGKKYHVEGLKLRSHAMRYKVIECKPSMVHGLDRKGMNALRKNTQEFRVFLSGLMKVKDYTLTDEELGELDLKSKGALQLYAWRNDTAGNVARFKQFVELVESGDSGNWYSAAMWLCASGRRSGWNKKFDPRSVVSLLDDILIALNPTVLIQKPLDVGDIRVDAYKRFTPFLEEWWS